MYIRTYVCSQLCDGIFVWGTPICRFKNKSAYVQLTLKSMVAKEMELHKHLRVTVDGEELKLPALEGLVLLNIQSWAAGADPWGTTGSEVGGWGRRWAGLLTAMSVVISSISRSTVDCNSTKF